MKVKSLLLVALLALVAVACGKKEADTVEVAPLTVDEVFASASELLGDTIEVEGVCSHQIGRAHV